MVNTTSMRAMWHHRGGASAVEFALILPVLLVLMLGTVQVSLLMYSYNLMVGGARDAVRAMAVCTITTPVDATNEAKKNLPPWVSNWSISPVFGDPDVSMTISVDPAEAAILSYVPFNLGTLTASWTMRKEPLAFGGC